MKRSVMNHLAKKGAVAKKKTKKTAKEQMMKKGSSALVKAPSSRYVRKNAKKGSMSMVKSPKANMKLRTKKAKKNLVSGKSFGDEKEQGLPLEHARERMNGVKKGAKKRKSAKKASGHAS